MARHQPPFFLLQLKTASRQVRVPVTNGPSPGHTITDTGLCEAPFSVMAIEPLIFLVIAVPQKQQSRVGPPDPDNYRSYSVFFALFLKG